MENSQKPLAINQTEFYIKFMLQIMDDSIAGRLATKQENCLLILFKKPSTMNVAKFSDAKDSCFYSQNIWELENNVTYWLILVTVIMYPKSLWDEVILVKSDSL